MKPFQQRVVEEQKELDIRLGKLRVFIGTATFKDLPTAERKRMWRQLDAMTVYSNVLVERIEAFE